MHFKHVSRIQAVELRGGGGGAEARDGDGLEEPALRQVKTIANDLQNQSRI